MQDNPTRIGKTFYKPKIETLRSETPQNQNPILPGSPVALYRPPMPVNKNSIPSILERFFSDLHARLITHTLTVSFDFNARQTAITVERKESGTFNTPFYI